MPSAICGLCVSGLNSSMNFLQNSMAFGASKALYSLLQRCRMDLICHQKWFIYHRLFAWLIANSLTVLKSFKSFPKDDKSNNSFVTVLFNGWRYSPSVHSCTCNYTLSEDMLNRMYIGLRLKPNPAPNPCPMTMTTRMSIMVQACNLKCSSE